ncbi:MAG: TIGR01841 family phasin [Marinovum sp.]|nr:TIGR01841 family phasin [Marinovum sp.]
MADDKSNPFMDMFSKFGEGMNIPGTDVSAIMDMHRKNLQAFQAVTQIGTSGAQAVMDKQREALESTLADISETVQSVTQGDTSGLMTAPTEIAKKSFDATIKNMSDVAEIVKQGNMDAFEVVKDRVTESINEMAGKTG